MTERVSVYPLTNIVVRGGVEFPVEPRVMDLLVHLVSRPGEVVSKAELIDKVWNAHVVDEAVHRAVSLLRSALGDSPQRSTIIETVPRRGYRLLVRPAPIASTGWPAGMLLASAAAAVGVAVLMLAYFIRTDAAPWPARSSSPVLARAASLPALPAADQEGLPAAAPHAAPVRFTRAAPKVVVAAPEPERSRGPEGSTMPEAAPIETPTPPLASAPAPSAPRAAQMETPAPPPVTAPAPPAN